MSKRLQLAAMAGAVAGSLGLLSGQASAFDCAKAQTAIEKAICADPDLTAADHRLEKAYATLRDRLPPDQRTALQLSERGWLRQRNDACDGQPPEKSCLLDQTNDRADQLEGRPLFATGNAPHFLPTVFALSEPGKDGTAWSGREVEIFYPQIDGDGPMAKSFNQAIRRTALGGDSFKPDEPPFYYDGNYTIHYAAADFISVEIAVSVFLGGAHGNDSSEGVTLYGDGRRLTLDDLLDAKGKAAATRFCQKALAVVKQERGIPSADIANDLTDDAVSTNTGDIKKWWFDQQGAVVHYDPYAIGAYAEGDYDCVIPWHDLKAIVKPTAPLPFPS